MTIFKTKRIYESADINDGYRVLVDRLWPRGVSKERAMLGDWAKDIAPSNELRTWFNHDPVKFPEFIERYKMELDQNPEFKTITNKWLNHKTVTLLYAAKDETHNEAEVLKKIVSDQSCCTI